MRKLALMILALMGVLPACSCDLGSGGGTGDGQMPRPNRVTGLVRNIQGQPVEGAEIEVHNTVYAASVSTRTGADGRYRVDVPAGSWTVLGSKSLSYHGATYCLGLKPETREAFAAADGAVRNFTFVISGPAEGVDGTPYGGKIDGQLYADGFVQGSSYTLNLVLEPDGPLIDGSTGERLSYPINFVSDGSSNVGFYVKDIPLGRYVVSATLVGEDGSSRTLRAQNRDSESQNYATNRIAFDGGFLGCGSEYYSNLELSP